MLETKAHDREYGGYAEFFAPDWSTPPPEAQPLGTPEPDLKLMNTPLHVMEAFTTYYRLI